jgi:hypothetical protein
MPTAEEARVVPLFKIHSIKNEAKSKEAGRPIYDDMEVVEVRFAGDRNRVGVFPAHAFAGWVTNPADGSQEEQTYAMRWPEQYKRFKMNHQQVAEGTPLEEVPFLTQGKRLELKALSILTAEALAALDGNELKALGIGGRELKNQAIAYLDAASGSAVATKMAADNEAMKDQIAEMRREMEELRAAAKANKQADEFAGQSDEDLKAIIKAKTGQAPRGNPSRATLVAMAREVGAQEAA